MTTERVCASVGLAASPAEMGRHRDTMHHPEEDRRRTIPFQPGEVAAGSAVAQRYPNNGVPAGNREQGPLALQSAKADFVAGRP